MRATKSRTIPALLVVVGASFAVSATVGAPGAVAEPGTIACQQGQIVIAGQCAAPDTNANNVPAPRVGTGPGMNGGGSGMGGGDHGLGQGR